MPSISVDVASIKNQFPAPKISQRIIDRSLYSRCIKEGFSETVSRIIGAREVNTSLDSIAHALSPNLNDIESPDSLIDIDKAVDRLLIAKANEELITLCTDFDADGQTSLSVLYRGLLLLGFNKSNLTYMSAHRLIEGYGLNEKVVERILAQKPRCTLIVTADNGSSNAESIAKLSDNGIDVIVTDHHALIDGPPSRAVAVVNPIREDCSFPDKSIAGCSVAFMLLIALRKKLIELGDVSPSVSIAPLLSFCGLGVQADCVHLGKSLSNRAMVRFAISAIQRADTFVCWSALKKLSKNDEFVIDSEFLSFTIAPAINAAGRMDTAKHAGDLFLTDNIQHADALVEDLRYFNESRKVIERSMTRAAKILALKNHLIGKKGLICFLPDGNPGVVGIVSSRITSMFGKPSCILSPMANDPDLLTGSLRSPEAYSIKDGIAFIKNHFPNLLVRGGGHERAGGLSFYKAHLLEFEEAFELSICEQLNDESILQPTLETDGEIDPDMLSVDLYREISALQPFGQGFPKPVFECVGKLVELRMVGKPCVHAQLNIKLGKQHFKGIWFFCKDDPEADEPIAVNQEYRFIFSLGENIYKGISSLQLIIGHCEVVNNVNKSTD